MGDINLDKAKAARTEALGDGHTITFGGETFELPAEMPIEFSWIWAERGARPAFAFLLGDDNWKRLLELKPSKEDFTELVSGVERVYGLDEGEAEASGS